MSLNYEEEIKKAYFENMITPQITREKIRNDAEQLGVSEDFIKCMANTNDVYLLYRYTVNPIRQSIHQKLAFNYIKKHLTQLLPGATIKLLPSGGSNALCVRDGKVGPKKDYGNDSVKTIDFQINYNDLIIYIAHKYTKDKGGTQDHQYKELRRFIKEASNNVNSKLRFIALADGDYYTDVMSDMRALCNKFTKVMTIGELIDDKKILEVVE